MSKTFPLTRKDAAVTLSILEDNVSMREEIARLRSEIARLQTRNIRFSALFAKVMPLLETRVEDLRRLHHENEDDSGYYYDWSQAEDDLAKIKATLSAIRESA